MQLRPSSRPAPENPNGSRRHTGSEVNQMAAKKKAAKKAAKKKK